MAVASCVFLHSFSPLFCSGFHKLIMLETLQACVACITKGQGGVREEGEEAFS